MIEGSKNLSLAMQLEQVRFLEFVLPDEIYESVYESDIGQEYHSLLKYKGCTAIEFGRAEQLYRTLLMSILTDGKLMSRFIN